MGAGHQGYAREVGIIMAHSFAALRKCTCLAAVAGLMLAVPVQAQNQAAAQQQAAQLPMPSETELAKLLWSTMIAVDTANLSGNYSVLRDNAASGFQAANNPARLAEIFAPLRAQQLDLANTLLVAPSYTAAPRMVQAGMIEVQGVFPIRPTPVRFAALYQWEQGRWKLFGIDVGPLQAAQPAPAQPQSRPAR